MPTYTERWGKPRQRTVKGHPLREARRQRAMDRAMVHKKVLSVSNGKPVTSATAIIGVNDQVEK